MTSQVKKSNFSIPNEVSHVTETLKKQGFEAYLIGGCVRDIFLGLKPKDWDVTTNATPEEIIKVFPKTFYENDYGTVGVVDENTQDETLKVIEVTPYRLEAEYTDRRRPDKVTWSNKLEDDLRRRDFTINAIAYDVENKIIVDPFDGQGDLDKKIIKTVGNSEERFAEDGLRILRAVRIHAELGFSIELKTEQAIKKMANIMDKIARERVRDEFMRIIMSDMPMDALISCHQLGILKFIIPELEKGVGTEQNKSHIYDVWTHLLKSVQYAADKKFPLEIRLAALLHDVSKPETRRKSSETGDFTFYGHEVVGARTVEKILKNLKFSKDILEKVVKLVRWHMFFSDTEQISLSAARRMVANVGKENIWDLMNVRICDRMGMGRPKEDPYRLRKYKSMIEQVMSDPITVGMLKIDGRRLMEVAKLAPGPKIGNILHALLEEVLENPKLNTEEYLGGKAIELAKLSDKELAKIGEKAKEMKEIEEEKKIEKIRGKYHVR